MAYLKYNPLDSISSQLTDGFTYLGANLPDTGNDLNVINDKVLSYINTQILQSEDPLSPIVKGAFYSLLPTTVNSFTNNEIVTAEYYSDPEQQSLIRAISEGIKMNTIDSLNDYFDSASELVVQSELSVSLKTPLFAAIVFAKASYDFWMTAINTTNGWTRFLNSNIALNYPNIPFWVSASFEGALSGFSQLQSLSMEMPDILNDLGRIAGINGALAGALGLTASKIILHVVQKPNLLALTNVIHVTGGNALDMDDKLSKRRCGTGRCCENTNQGYSTCRTDYCPGGSKRRCI